MNAIPIQSPFSYRRSIRWGDADVAGIVFTAHYFDICMEAIESWFIEALELEKPFIVSNFLRLALLVAFPILSTLSLL